MGGLDIRTMLAKALHMGDDGHNRLDAASLLWTTQLAPYIAKTAKDTATAFEVIKFLGENALSILNPVMAACKTMTDAGHNVEGSTIVTIMAATAPIRHPRQRAGRPLVHRALPASSRRSISPASRRKTPTRISATASSLKQPALAVLPWPPPPRW